MSRIANTLFVTTPGSRVGVQRGALMVENQEGSRTRVPMESIEWVMLYGGSAITTEAAARCVRMGIRVASLTRGGRIRFVCTGPTSGNVHLRVAQLRRADDPLACMSIAKLLIAGKLGNSLRLVSRWKWDAEEPERTIAVSAEAGIRDAMLRIHGAPSGDHLRGIEGEAARWLFKALGAHLARLGPAFSFLRRSRRPPGDPTNAALSFGYGILVAELVGAADTVGLDPQVGFLHGIRSGRPSLALDLVEEQRSIVDAFVASRFRRRQLRLEHFVETPGGGWFMNDEGRRAYLALFDEYRQQEVHHALLQRMVPMWTLPVLQATLLARYLRGDLDAYVPWQSG